MDKKQIFRQGKDIYALDNDSAKLLGPSEFQTDYASQSQNVKDLGQREDLYNKYFPKTPSIVEETVGGANAFSDGSGDIADDANRLTALGTNVENATADTGGKSAESIFENLSSRVSELTAGLTTLRDQATGLKTISSDEQRQIDASGETAGAAFDPLIEEARRTKAQGMGEAVVGAGQRGGLMNTQFAGVGAFMPGVGAVGAGGKLENIKSAYDLNISKLQIAKQQAIDAAKSAARQAIKSGKQADFDNATKLFELAKSTHEQAISETASMVNIINSINAEKRAGASFGLDQATKYYNIAKDIPAGETVTINGVSFTGMNIKSVDDFFKGSDIISLMKSLPAGRETSITDPNTGREYTLMGLSSDDPNIKSVEATNDKGEVTVTRYDQNTGEILSQVSLGQVGKTKTQAANVTLNMNNEEKAGLTAALNTLEATRGEKYNSAEVAKQYRIYNQAHPGKGDQLLEAIKAEVNYGDQVIKELYDKKMEDESAIEITTSDGRVIKF